MSILTDARRSVWDAIDNWPALQGKFRAKFRGDDESGRTLEKPGKSSRPESIADLPAIEIRPATNDLNWILNQVERSKYALAVTIWTPGWTWPLTEELWEQVVRAVVGGTVGNAAVPEVKRVTGAYPDHIAGRFDRITFDGNDNGVKLIQHTFGLALKVNLQPLR